DVADVVLIEDEERPQLRVREGAAHAGQAIVVQSPEVHTLFEVHLHVSGSLDGTVPAMPRIRRLGLNSPGRCGSGLAGHAFPPVSYSRAGSTPPTPSPPPPPPPQGGERAPRPPPTRRPGADSRGSRCLPRRPAARPPS